jgi:uncharacterized protein (UPF0179 family)
MTMNIRKHFFMTFAALFFLGLIVAKPGETFYPAKEMRDCKLDKGKMTCVEKGQEYRINYSVIQYQFEQ